MIINSKKCSYLIMGIISRINTLHMISCAGSGHIGSSFSSMELFIYLTCKNKFFFSSKGHDIPGLYSVMIMLNKLEFKYLHLLRKLDGLPGHPDISIDSIVTNTGSLGMGVAKAKGFVFANRMKNIKKDVIVICGDGELQEGSFWESLVSLINYKMNEITIIIDHNKYQSDMSIKDTSDLGCLKSKFKAYGFIVSEINGNSFDEIEDIFLNKNIYDEYGISKSSPHIIIAHTIKGYGVSFLESRKENLVNNLYKYHSGCLNKVDHIKATTELLTKLNSQLDNPIKLKEYKYYKSVKDNLDQNLVKSYSDILFNEVKNNKNIIILDNDLCVDTGILPIKNNFPNQFIECGIAEMDSVSTAGTLSLKKFIPIVHSFASFLTSRANEQIFNNSTENTKIIYMGFLAGILPAGPGHSHQMIRDTSIMSSIPGMICAEPCNSNDLKIILKNSLRNQRPTYIRVVSIPTSEISYSSKLFYKKGVTLKEGKDILIISSGSIMLNTLLKVANNLNNISIKIVNLPWLNIVDDVWFSNLCKKFKNIIFLENHYIRGGQNDFLLSKCTNLNITAKIKCLGINELPTCGENNDVLRYHDIDFNAIKKHILIEANKENIGIIIQARTSSTRLKGKILKEIGNTKISFLKLQILRLQQIKSKVKIIIAISEKDPESIIQLCKELNIDYFVGSNNNVLDRTYKAAIKYNIDIVTRIVSDCPFIDIELVDYIIDKYKTTQCNYLSNLHPPTWPDGNDIEIMDINTLKLCVNNSTEDYQKEHVTPYIWSNPNIFNIKNVINNVNLFKKYRFVLDFPEDYLFFNELYKKIEESTLDNIAFSNKEVIKILNKNIDIYKINQKHKEYQWYNDYKFLQV